MKIFDPLAWSPDKDYGVEDIKTFTAHFEVTLSAGGFDSDKLLPEWKAFKFFVTTYMKGMDAKTLWHQILNLKRSEFPNLCLCAEIMIATSGSNSSVERGFSILTLILSDRRLQMGHAKMDMLLNIAVNDKNWSEEERCEIIDRTVEIYLEKRRKTKTSSSTAASQTEEPASKFAKISSDSDSDDHVSEISDTDSSSEDQLDLQ